MFRLFMVIVTFMMALYIYGCGGGSAANGNTVSVTPGISQNTAGSVFGNISSTASGNVFTANPISITLTSVPVRSPGTVIISPVRVDRITMTLSPLPFSSIPANTNNALSPTIPIPQYSNILQGVGGVIPGPGTLKIDGIDLIGISDAQVMLNAFLSSGFVSVQYHYIANLTFHCTESNTGSTLNISNPIGVDVHF